MPSRDVNRIVLVPRWAGSGESDFYPWLREQVGVTVTAAPLLPSPGAPEVEPTTEAVLRALGDDPEALAATVLMGHSVGVQAAMRALARLGDGRRVRGLLCVAGWWSVDAPWPALLPWQAPFAFERARAAAGSTKVLLSDGDPYTTDAGATARLFEERVGAEVVVVPGAKHFNATPQPEVLAALRAWLPAPSR
ncbi:MAG TPA: alpha/beta hydrolase [Polyangiaceae bacterium]|nr:alpha/beta hydrolase [Polyangiaceae bacterium]